MSPNAPNPTPALGPLRHRLAHPDPRSGWSSNPQRRPRQRHRSLKRASPNPIRHPNPRGAGRRNPLLPHTSHIARKHARRRNPPSGRMPAYKRVGAKSGSADKDAPGRGAAVGRMCGALHPCRISQGYPLFLQRVLR